MPGTLHFEFNKAALRARMYVAADRALERLKEDAHNWWLIVVPVITGHLRDSWAAIVIESTTGVALIFGATARYAIYVELGSVTVGPPRAPIRTTAGEIVHFVIPYLREELTK